MIDSEEKPEFADKAINLASARLGARVVEASDDFFADRQRMLKDEPAVFLPEKFDEHGKWMDGWETKRRRHGGHDHAIIKLPTSGFVLGFDVSTLHFTGNNAPAVSIKGARVGGGKLADAKWTSLLQPSPTTPNSHNFFKVPSTLGDKDNHVDHLVLSIFPDGGVARFRAYGVPTPDSHSFEKGTIIESSALLAGARIIDYSDAHYGSPWSLLWPDKSRNMADGWETRRRRRPGFDWAIIHLAVPTLVDHMIIDTDLYKGNAPKQCAVHASFLEALPDVAVVADAVNWRTLLPPQDMKPHAPHRFDKNNFTLNEPITHLRLDVHPDGGVSRLKVFGTPQL